MPAKSDKQRKAFAIAEHHPEELYERNKAMERMSHKELHDFASTKGLKKKKHTPKLDAAHKKFMKGR